MLILSTLVGELPVRVIPIAAAFVTGDDRIGSDFKMVVLAQLKARNAKALDMTTAVVRSAVAISVHRSSPYAHHALIQVQIDLHRAYLASVGLRDAMHLAERFVLDARTLAPVGGHER